MRIGTRKKSVMEEAAIDMAPLIDMTFLLLIFFLVNTNFIKETGIEVTELRPFEWMAPLHPTLLFGHGNNLSPGSYHCYAQLLGERCIRTLMPRLWNTDDGDLPHLGWEARQLRWDDTVAVYDELTAQQDDDLVFIGGHSMGAYTTLLGAGAVSVIGEEQGGNCELDGDQIECETLDAAGYVIVSGWPAQSAQNDPPFWFDHAAFEDLLPSRFVAYGELDSSSGDPCLAETPPSCRGDSYWIDETEADELNLIHEMVTGFDHLDFACGANWETAHSDPDAIADFVEGLAHWIWDLALDDGSAGDE